MGGVDGLRGLMKAYRDGRRFLVPVYKLVAALVLSLAANPALSRELCSADIAELDTPFRAAQMALTSRPSVAIERTLVLPDAKRTEVRDLLAERDRLRGNVSGDASVGDALVENENQLALVEASINRAVPGLLDSLVPVPLGIEEIQSSLDEDAVLLLYLEDDERSYGWAISRDCAMWRVLEDFGRIESAALVEGLRKGLSPASGLTRGRSIDLSDSAGIDIDQELARAYQHVVSPFEAVIADKKTILLRAEGNFLALPFSALKAAPDAEFLVETHAFAWLPTLRGFSDTAAAKPLHSRKSRLLAVGAPSGGEMVGGRATPAPLPGAEIELATLQERLRNRVTVLSGEAATETRLIDALQAENADVVLFATHALVGGRNDGGLTGLVLTPNPLKAGEFGTGDGLLSPVEIAGLPLDRKSVILAACDTWAGEDGGSGEALTALALSFLQAGASDLVVTHWPVTDGSAAVWSQTMMSNLLENREDLPEAVRAGQLALMRQDGKRYDHPRYWAAFIPVLGSGVSQER